MMITSRNWPTFVARLATLLSCAGMLDEILQQPIEKRDSAGPEKGTVPG
jgi:hypothetical protein